VIATATATTPQIHPPFSFGDSCHAADILEGARSVTRFLAEVAPYMTDDKGNYLGLSERGAFGLQLILEALERKLGAASEAL